MTVGQLLSAARVAEKLTVKDVADATRLRVGLIEAIEADDLGSLGGDTYARGHLKAYARVVGLDPDEVLAVYAEQVGADVPTADELVDQTPAAARALPLAPVSAASLADGARSLSPVMRHKREANWTKAMVGALVVVLLIGGIALVGKLGNSPKQNPIALPTLTPTATPTATPSATPSANPSTSPTPSAPPSDLVAQAPGATVQLDVKGTPAWVSVTGVSKGTLFQGILRPGTSNTYNDKSGVKLVIGNAGAVNVTVNGNNLGIAGSQGQVVRLAFGPDGAPA